MAHSMQKNKIEFLEQRVDQLEMFISTLEEQNKFMKDIVTQQNELIKFMAEQNTVNIDKMSHHNKVGTKDQENEHIKSADNADHDLLPNHKDLVVIATPAAPKKSTIGRRVL